MKKNTNITDTIDDAQLLDEVRYYEPNEELPLFADHPISLITPILARRIDPAAPDFKGNTLHKHCEFEFITVLSGSISLNFGDMSIHVGAGGGICIKRGVPHMIEADSGQPTELELVHFHHSVLFGTTISMLGSKNLFGILHNSAYRYSLYDPKDPDDAAILKRAHDVYAYMNSDLRAGELRAISALYDIWGMDMENRIDITVMPLTKQQALDNQRIAKATEYISEHYAEDILLSDISKVCDVSDSECCRTFQRALHSSPIDYINRYRVFTAAEILTNDVNNTPMSDIALMVGFNYASYFNKTFKRYIGITPMQYRKKNNKGEIFRKGQQEFRI